MLKNSARNCVVKRSVSFVFLNSEASQRKFPGPTTMSRGELPGRAGGFTGVQVGADAGHPGFTNAAVLNHWLTVFGAPTPGSPTRSGRAPDCVLPHSPRPAKS